MDYWDHIQELASEVNWIVCGDDCYFRASRRRIADRLAALLRSIAQRLDGRMTRTEFVAKLRAETRDQPFVYYSTHTRDGKVLRSKPRVARRVD